MSFFCAIDMTKVCTKYKQDAGQHPNLDGGQPFSFGRVGCDVVENVDQDQEERDEQGHASCKAKSNQIEHNSFIALAQACRVLMHKLSVDKKGGRYYMSRFFFRGYLRRGRNGGK